MFHLIKNIIVNLYKGLIYWFFWASFVTLRDEMFCSFSAAHNEDKCYEITSSDTSLTPPVKVATTDAYKLFYNHYKDLRKNILCALSAFDAYTAHNLANLRALINAAKELPQRHLLRISLYSG